MSTSTAMRVKRFTATRDNPCSTSCGATVSSGDPAGHIPGIDGVACAPCCDRAEQADGVTTVGDLTPTSDGPVRQLATPVAHAAAIAAQLQGAAKARAAKQATRDSQPAAVEPTSDAAMTTDIALPAEPCPDCRQSIVWALTSKNKRMPVDAAPVADGNIHLELDGDTVKTTVLGKAKADLARDTGTVLHQHHRLTCAQAAKWADNPDSAPGNPRGHDVNTLAEIDGWVRGDDTPAVPTQRAAETATPHHAEQDAVAQLAAEGAAAAKLAAQPAAATTEQVADDQPEKPLLADLTPWAVEATGRGGDPDLVGRELVEAFRLGILAGDIRGRQKEIGPSGLGHPCARATAYLLAGVPPTGTQDTPWRQAVGTAMHDRGDLWAHLDNQRRGTRWLTNLRVSVGELYPGREIRGTLDYLDVLTATVVDLKVPGTTAMKTYGPGKPESPQYRVQLHAYGRGVLRAGFLPAHVGILRVSPARELADAIFKVERFDEQVAADALNRVGGIARMVDAIGPAAAAALPPTEHYCSRCDWFRPGATDLTSGCPGAPGAVKPRRDQLDALVG